MHILGEDLAKALKLLQDVPLIDGHNDFPYFLRGWYPDQVNTVDCQHMPIAHTDLERLSQGRVGGVFWSAYVPCPDANASNDFSVDVHHQCLRETLQQIDIIHGLIERYPKNLGLATTSTEVWNVFKSGRVASLIGVEGLHQIANSPGVMRNFHRLGVRYITLTHDSNNLYADSTNSAGPFHRGLSADGISMVKEMNRVGMIVDLSHTSIATQKDVLAVSKAPVIFSHSSCSSVTEHPRNSPDDVLDMLQRNGGVFMITFIRKSTDSINPCLERVADHVQHVGDRIGYDHVGIGSDFDGVMQTTSGLDDVSKFPLLIAELLRRRVSEQSIQKMIGLNMLRVMDAVEQVSTAMKEAEEEVLSDTFEEIWDNKVQEEVTKTRGVFD
ncbi:hypothetical protein V2G26_002048 [Clonostachys chloroleuca]